MKTRFCIIASVLVPSFLCTSVLTGCGGSSQSEEIYLPVGTARNVEVSLENGQVYTLAFEVTSSHNAYVYSGESAAPSSASLHVRGYIPADDSAAEVSLYWYTNRDGEDAFPCYLIMTDVKNVTKGNGTATCAVSDLYFVNPAATDRPGTLKRFNQ